MKHFWVDPALSLKKTYNDLVGDLNRKTGQKKYICQSGAYEVLLEMISALAYGMETHLLDAGFSKVEIENMGIPLAELDKKVKIDKMPAKDLSGLYRSIQKNGDKSAIVIYTSGTTGRPKKVVHNLSSLTRTVKVGERFENDVWGFAYNVTHFAGVQVFLQGFLNRNTMINIFDLDPVAIFSALQKYRVTNVSATPTFYKKILINVHQPLPHVKRITLGGEKYDRLMEKELKALFPAAVIRNIYASTEAGSLFTADGEVFTVDEKTKPYIRIDKRGALLVHKSMLGQFSSQDMKGDWYDTGDVVERLEDDKFRFVSRKTEMINVGGYKVNPHEVEDEIRKVAGILDVVVKARENRITGNILIAEVVKSAEMTGSEAEDKIMSHLSKVVRNYKIPRIIKFRDQLNLTRTGKKERL